MEGIQGYSDGRLACVGGVPHKTTSEEAERRLFDIAWASPLVRKGKNEEYYSWSDFRAIVGMD